MQQALRYDLGLDIGIASVGWCVLGEQRIIDLGVRAFDKAETPEGESLNAGRRSARLLRRRLRRRAWRLLKLARLLKHEGLIASSQLFQRQVPITQSLWILRVEALDRCLGGEEWARVIYHLCKHRGFWFARTADAMASEGGKVKQGLERTRALMEGKGYRTAAEMMLAEFPDNQRNKRGDYGQSLARDLLAEELACLFACQRELGNPHAATRFESAILAPETGLFWQQKPALSGEAMLNLIGKCTFEHNEYRAAKHSWSAERFVWLTRLNNLRISINGESRPLNADERVVALNLPYELASVKYKQLKTKLVTQGLWSADVRFTGLNYRDGSKDPEDAKLIELKGWHTLRKALEKGGLKTEWQSLSNRYYELDQIATILSLYKTDNEVVHELGQLGLAKPIVNALSVESFSDFVRLSLKALSGILPQMEQGKRYDEACLAAGYHHSMAAEKSLSHYLPKFDGEAPNNPVVLRALNQARKVVNALIRKYGPPYAVHIEMARDLSRPLDERQKIEKDQKEYATRNEQDRIRFAEAFGRSPTGREFEKWQLYHEQHGKCAYSLTALDLNRLIDDATYAEIDHALPYSRSFDDSKNNKVLVLTAENRNKGNRTPYEYLGGAVGAQQWLRFVTFVSSNHSYRQAKRDRLLRKHFNTQEATEFKARNLNDTRYACRYFKNFVENHLALHPEGGHQRCVVVSGQLTSFLRARWGLAKLRKASDRHHAIDAAVVAACSHGMVKRLSDFARRKELDAVREGFVDLETGEVVNLAILHQLDKHFPRPWLHFDDELCMRAGQDRSTGRVRDDLPLDEMRKHLAVLGYDELALAKIRPLFVSRAPKRRNGGAAHKDTIYAARSTNDKPNRVTQKLPLTDLTLAHFGGQEYDEGGCSLIEPHRNARLYRALHERLLAHGGKADKAFATPFYKPSVNHEREPLVRGVTLVIDKLSGIPIRGGLAKNDSMIRVDVFGKAGKFHLVPVYVHHRVAKALPNRAIVQGKDEDEWTLIDDSFEFRFSVYPNDLLRIQQKGKPMIEGYYAGCDRATGNLAVWAHDRDQQQGKDGLIRGIGVKTAVSVEKFNVDVLGRVYPAKSEVRRGLA